MFLINVPIAAAALIAAVSLVPDSRNQQASRPDVTGALLSMAGFGLLLFGIIEAPNRAWTSPVILGALTGAAAIIVAFIVWERHTSHPMLPLHFFRNRRYTMPFRLWRW